MEPGNFVTECRHDVVTASPIMRLATLLDYDRPPWPVDEVPPLGHWLFHLPDARQSALGVDGHPAKGGAMPAATPPRRMWAGSRVRFLDRLRVGDTVERRSTVSAVQAKGAMTFVTVNHTLFRHDVAILVEEQDLVYLPARTAGEQAEPKPVEVPDAERAQRVVATSPMLFRFSALTYNAHRIHYDLPYATGEEHYPGLVVHGPLLATLLMNLALGPEPAARVTSFDFRARAPVTCGEPFELCQRGRDLWIRRADGAVAMTAGIAMA